MVFQVNKNLEEMGFAKCPYEQAVYTRKSGAEVLIVVVYVDDLLVTGTNNRVIESFKKEMNNRFDMSDLNKLSYFLGIEAHQGEGYIQLKQSRYAKKVLAKAGMLECNATKYPMDPRRSCTRMIREF